jgi:hypothetical protein
MIDVLRFVCVLDEGLEWRGYSMSYQLSMLPRFVTAICLSKIIVKYSHERQNWVHGRYRYCFVWAAQLMCRLLLLDMLEKEAGCSYRDLCYSLCA